MTFSSPDSGAVGGVKLEQPALAATEYGIVLRQIDFAKYTEAGAAQSFRAASVVEIRGIPIEVRATIKVSVPPSWKSAARFRRSTPSSKRTLGPEIKARPAMPEVTVPSSRIDLKGGAPFPDDGMAWGR